MSLPREKACPWCERRWKSKPATASYCPNKRCQYLLVDLRPGDRSNGYKGEHFQCLACPHPATEFLAFPKKVDRPDVGGYDWSGLECPECSYKLRKALEKSGLSGEDLQEKYRDLSQMYFEWLSYGWWLPPRKVMEKVYATTARKELLFELPRIEHGPYTSACLPESG